MNREYSPLMLIPLAPGARIAEPAPPSHVRLDDPALWVMTDFLRVTPATTTPGETIEEAHALMIRRGVKLLIVVDFNCAIAGVLTATDLLGEKPVKFMQERGLSHAEVQVADVMTPLARLEASPMDEVAEMQVGHIVQTLKVAHRQHLLVAEDGGSTVRGLFSLTQIARQLGIELHTSEIAQTFADIEAALVR